jgi:glycine cleavage system protein P-like pyridoxal-binding family
MPAASLVPTAAHRTAAAAAAARPAQVGAFRVVVVRAAFLGSVAFG